MAAPTVGSVEAKRSTAAVTAPSKKYRDPFIDNAKFLAIALVAIGHFVGPVLNEPLGAATFVTIFTFHMPAFVFIAGYLSRGFKGTPKQAQRVVTTIVAPYLVFEISYEVFLSAIRGNSIKLDVLNPSYAMWFLAALFFWRLSAPVWRAMKPSVAIAAAVAISLGSAAMDLPGVLDLHRMLGFLPFFVAGLVLPLDRYFAFVRRLRTRALGTVGLAGFFVATYFLHPHTTAWLYYSKSYSELGVSTLTGLANRSLMLILGCVMTTAFLAVVPRRQLWFTALGAGTLYVYVLHRFIVKAGTGPDGLYDSWEWLHTPLGVVAIVAFGFGVTVVLSSAPVRALFRPLVEPRLEWLFRRETDASSSGRG
ncbi:MAG: acyltransferase [Actinophytocola sp.]|nr:acyltransferase [Actinophytocola sp.]